MPTKKTHHARNALVRGKTSATHQTMKGKRMLRNNSYCLDESKECSNLANQAHKEKHTSITRGNVSGTLIPKTPLQNTSYKNLPLPKDNL